jgi:hypothetical protein
MNPNDLRTRIQSSTERLVNEIAAAFAETLTGAVAAALGAALVAPRAKPGRKPGRKPGPKPVAKPVAKRGPGRPPKAAAKPAAPKPVAPKAAKAGKRVRRSGEQLQADGDRIMKLLAANKKGLRIEQINKMLEAPAKQLARPIMMLLGNGKIKKMGQKRATVYLPA